jgi:hypothetical protein
MKTREHLSAALLVLLNAIVAVVRQAHSDPSARSDSWSDWDPFATGYRADTYPVVDGLWSPSRATHWTDTTFSIFEWRLPRARRRRQ